MSGKKVVEPLNSFEPAKPVEPAKVAEALKIGDLVKIRNYGIKRGRVVELRGPLAPGGKQVYRVRVRRKPTPVYIELREDQLVLIPATK